MGVQGICIVEQQTCSRKHIFLKFVQISHFCRIRFDIVIVSTYYDLNT